jgi:hypothetical protein
MNDSHQYLEKARDDLDQARVSYLAWIPFFTTYYEKKMHAAEFYHGANEFIHNKDHSSALVLKMAFVIPAIFVSYTGYKITKSLWSYYAKQSAALMRTDIKLIQDALIDASNGFTKKDASKLFASLKNKEQLFNDLEKLISIEYSVEQKMKLIDNVRAYYSFLVVPS